MPSGSPTSPLLCGSPTPRPRRWGLWFPSPPSTSGMGACSCPPPGAPMKAPSASELGGRVSPGPALPGEGSGSLGFLGRPSSYAPRAKTPPDTGPPCPLSAGSLLPSDTLKAWASGIVRFFGAVSSLARMFTHLRINRPVAGTTARLVTGPPGSALAGRDSHPLDDSSDFHRDSPSLLPVRPEFPDRNQRPTFNIERTTTTTKRTKNGEKVAMASGAMLTGSFP